MTGRKTLAEVRAELEAALGGGPKGDGVVADSLRRFLAAGRDQTETPPRPTPQPKSPERDRTAKGSSDTDA